MPISTLPLLRNKLARRDRWQRIFLERLTGPLHLNLLSLPVLLFGSYRTKIAPGAPAEQRYIENPYLPRGAGTPPRAAGARV